MAHVGLFVVAVMLFGWAGASQGQQSGQKQTQSEEEEIAVISNTLAHVLELLRDDSIVDIEISKICAAFSIMLRDSALWEELDSIGERGISYSIREIKSEPKMLSAFLAYEREAFARYRLAKSDEDFLMGIIVATLVLATNADRQQSGFANSVRSARASVCSSEKGDFGAIMAAMQFVGGVVVYVNAKWIRHVPFSLASAVVGQALIVASQVD